MLLTLMLPAFALAHPYVSFDEVSYNFGVIGQSEKPEHVFTFVNKGDRDLVIEKLSSS